MPALLRILIFAVLLCPLGAHAQESGERILSFISAVTIEKNGDYDVTETITLVSQGQEIKRGIQRDFPTSYSNGLGQSTKVGFTVLSVQRDGHDEPWERIGLSNGVRIRIGEADVMLTPGEHVYAIRYRTTRQLRYDAGNDEIYWNATGNGWTFPIDRAEARITLPSEARFGDRAVYTGYQGSKDQNAEVIAERPGYIAFRTTRPLEREQGLTVAAAFPKGVVDAPGSSQRLGWWLEDWGALGAAFASFIGLIGFYLYSWIKVGRGPGKGTVVPIFTPPDDLTPAACRYIAQMKFDDRAYSAAIVYLGVRGHLHVDQEKGGWFSKGTTTLSRTDPPEGSEIAAPEKALAAALFSGGDSIELKQVNHSTLQSARSALRTRLESAYDGTMFRANKDWALLGVLAVPAAMVAIATVALLVSPSGGASALKYPVMMALFAGGAWWFYGLARKSEGVTMVVAWGAVLGGGFLAAMFALNALIAALSERAWAVFLPLLLLPIAFAAFKWMYAPTREGRAVMDRIAGFKQYLGIAEERRLETMHPPDKTPELFERYLPYAIALDVENRWAARFADVLAAAAVAGGAAHAASWYSGDSNVWNDPGGFAENMGSSLASTVSSASTSPSSSSSGSSGGGSSGGGGGGGGGSGW